MKKWFSNILPYLFLAAILLVPLALLFQDVYDVILVLGSGSLIAGILLLPFVVIGCINAFRGFGAVLQMDEAKYGHKLKDWKFYVYLLFYIGGYLALYYVLIHCL